MALSLSFKNEPLSTQEEVRLSTCGNFITMALFKPLDTYKAFKKASISGDAAPLTKLWEGWPKQILNKAVDDEIFNANIARVSNFAAKTLKITKPGKTAVEKACVGVAARALTLTAMIPFQALQDPKKRRAAFFDKSTPANSRIPMVLYSGFERSLLKESVFTASYVLGSAQFEKLFRRYRPCVAHQIKLYSKKAANDEEKEKLYTNAVMNAMKASAAGFLASMLAGPLDPKKPSPVAMVRKSLRKGSYNFVNTLVVQSLYATKVHRSILQTLLPPIDVGATSMNIVSK